MYLTSFWLYSQCLQLSFFSCKWFMIVIQKMQSCFLTLWCLSKVYAWSGHFPRSALLDSWIWHLFSLVEVYISCKVTIFQITPNPQSKTSKGIVHSARFLVEFAMYFIWYTITTHRMDSLIFISLLLGLIHIMVGHRSGRGDVPENVKICWSWDYASKCLVVVDDQ